MSTAEISEMPLQPSRGHGVLLVDREDATVGLVTLHRLGERS